MSVSIMVILVVLVLNCRQLDAFVKRPVYTYRYQHKLFSSWEVEAIKGVVTISSLLVFIALNDKRISESVAANDKRISEAGVASDKRFSEAGVASDKRFSDLVVSHSTIRTADKETLNAIIQKMSTEIQASNARTDAEIKSANVRTDAEIKAANARTDAEIKAANARMETVIEDSFDRMEEILRKRKSF